MDENEKHDDGVSWNAMSASEKSGDGGAHDEKMDGMGGSGEQGDGDAVDALCVGETHADSALDGMGASEKHGDGGALDALRVGEKYSADPESPSVCEVPDSAICGGERHGDGGASDAMVEKHSGGYGMHPVDGVLGSAVRGGEKHGDDGALDAIDLLRPRFQLHWLC